MTESQIRSFLNKRTEAKALEIKAKDLLQKSYDQDAENNLSCDHRNPDAKLAGHPFEGSYCGFICSICGCSVAYERMGY